MLKNNVWLDETYFSVIMNDRQVNEDVKYYRGISRSQICIGVATDKTNTLCIVEGFGRLSQKTSYDSFKDHIYLGSTLIHNKETTHKKLIKTLSLKSIAYSSKELKNLADSENPLNPVNRVHCLLKLFLNARSGFNRDDLQGYMNLYAFAINPPTEPLEKVEKIINLVFLNPKELRYREQFTEIIDHSPKVCK